LTFAGGTPIKNLLPGGTMKIKVENRCYRRYLIVSISAV